MPLPGISFLLVQRTFLRSSCAVSTPESITATITGTDFFPFKNWYALLRLIPSTLSVAESWRYHVFVFIFVWAWDEILNTSNTGNAIILNKRMDTILFLG